MIESALPNPGIGGKGFHLRRMLASAVSSLEVSKAAYGGRHPSAPALKATLDAAVAAVTAMLPAADAMTFNPTAKSYSIAGGALQVGPVLNRAPGNLGIVTYTSSDPTKATVNSAGRVTPLAAGSTTITATSPVYGGFLASTKTYVATVTA